MLRLEDLCFSYGKKTILTDINLSLSAGMVYALLGVNGSGKTTLLKLMGGLLKAQRGTIFIDHRDIQRLDRLELARTIAYMPQKTNGVYCTVFDAVLMGRRPHIGLEASGHDIETTSKIIRMLDLEHYAFRLTTELSGGELQKVVIARVLAQEPRIVLLDEPISHLDIKNQMDVMGLLRDVTKRLSLTTVVVLHDLNTALRYADLFIMLKDGRLFGCGSRELVTPEAIKAVYGVEACVHFIGDIPVVVPGCKDMPNITR